MASEQFRRQLSQEAGQWQAEGLISATQYQQLADRYQFATLDTVARNRFVLVLIGFGSVLLGLGVITFVAANWQAWSRELRVLLLLGLFVGVNAGGFYLWRWTANGWQRRLGQGFLLLGALILGANMALMAQMFHIGGDSYRLFLTWGIGVLFMAYSLRLASLSMLAILLIEIGYWNGLYALTSTHEFSWLQLMQEHMPLVSAALFVPLAHWCRSRAVFIAAAIAVLSSLQVNLTAFQTWNFPVAVIVALMLALPPALLWAYDDWLWPRLLRRPLPVTHRSFQPIARGLALLFLSLQFYVASFHWLWDSSSGSNPLEWSDLKNWVPLLDVLVLGTLAVVEWLNLAWQERRDRSYRQQALTTNVVGCFIVVAALIPLWHLGVSPIMAIATFGFNVLLLLLAVGLIRESLTQGDRRLFWGGNLLLALQILSRMLEYDTGLLFKSLVFILCGLGVIAAGLWFERYVRTLTPAMPSLPDEV